MPWTVAESTAPQAPVKPPGEPVQWDAVPAGSWVWLIGTKQYACKARNGSAMLAGDWLTASSVSSAIPCPSDWRFEASVIDGTLRFVPLVEVDREEEWIDGDSEDIEEGELVQDADGGWCVSNGCDRMVCLVCCGDSNKYRRPRGPVTLTYTPVGVE